MKELLFSERINMQEKYVLKITNTIGIVLGTKGLRYSFDDSIQFYNKQNLHKLKNPKPISKDVANKIFDFIIEKEVYHTAIKILFFGYPFKNFR